MATTGTYWSSKSWLGTDDGGAGEAKDRPCDRCHPADLYRDDRRGYERVLAVVGLFPYVCCTCQTRGLMFGRSYAFNWRWRRIRIRIIFRVAQTEGRRRFVSTAMDAGQ